MPQGFASLLQDRAQQGNRGFVVEQKKQAILHLDDARIPVLWLLRFRTEKLREFDVEKFNREEACVLSLCVSSNPISVRINEVLDPALERECCWTRH
jgi:hypothetical protein